MGLKVIAKVNQKVKFLSRKATLLDTHTRKVLSMALVQPHYDYASLAWYTSTPEYIKTKLQTSQNKLIRVVLNLSPRTHIGQSQFLELNWLPVGDRIKQLKLSLTHRVLNGSVPKYLNDYFKLVRDTHAYATRGSSTDIAPCRPKHEIGKETFVYSAAKEWNDLPIHIKEMGSIGLFKRAVKGLLLSRSPM